MQQVEAKISTYYLSLSLINPNQMLLKVQADDNQRTCLFEKAVEYGSLQKEIQFIFGDIRDLYDALQKVIKQNRKDSIVIQANGKVHLNLQINIYAKTITKTVIFILQQHLQPHQELSLLRTTIEAVRKEVHGLKQQMAVVLQENNILKAKYDYLEQAFVSHPNKQKKSEGSNKNLIKEFQAKVHVSDPPKQEQQIQIISEKPAYLNIQFDERCMYYSKFKIDNNLVTSLHEDYYQIYTKKSLPKKGIYHIKMRMIGENHLSVGILGKSSLHNQYSFQNNKAICFYSYHFGNFRGIYYRGKYQTLDWNIEKGEVLQMELDMNKKFFKIKMQKGTTTQIINFQQLYQQEPLYFFLQMYEKNNIVQFLA